MAEETREFKRDKSKNFLSLLLDYNSTIHQQCCGLIVRIKVEDVDRIIKEGSELEKGKYFWYPTDDFLT